MILDVYIRVGGMGWSGIPLGGLGDLGYIRVGGMGWSGQVGGLGDLGYIRVGGMGWSGLQVGGLGDLGYIYELEAWGGLVYK